MKPNKFKHYVHDLGIFIKEKAKNAKQVSDLSVHPDDNLYNAGYLMAFHEVVDLMKNLAIAFEIDQKDIVLEDIEAERDLI